MALELQHQQKPHKPVVHTTSSTATLELPGGGMPPTGISRQRRPSIMPVPANISNSNLQALSGLEIHLGPSPLDVQDEMEDDQLNWEEGDQDEYVLYRNNIYI